MAAILYYQMSISELFKELQDLNSVLKIINSKFMIKTYFVTMAAIFDFCKLGAGIACDRDKVLVVCSVSGEV